VILRITPQNFNVIWGSFMSNIMFGRAALTSLLLSMLVLSGCTTIPKDAFQLSATSLEDRQMQSRKFSTLDDTLLLSAGASVLQDLGYNIDESNVELGVLTASKQADAKNTGQIVGAVMVALLTGTVTPTDDKQKIRICLVLQESLDDPNSSVARITMQRIIWNNQGKISRVESIKSPELYQAFFDKLSKSTFLEANQI
jgi:hypothetical protein